MRTIIAICFATCFAKGLFAQTKLRVNGRPLSFDCAKVLGVDELDTIAFQRVKVYHAEINNNCLELSVTCGGCDANIELVSDHKPIEGQTLKLNFLLRYDANSKPCATTLKTKLYFDMLPYKNMRSGRFMLISLLGEKFNLSYK